MKAGFTFLELIIGLFISSVIMIALYSGFFVTGNVIKTSETVVGIDVHLAIIAHQLENDLSGVFVPLEVKETATTTDATTEKTAEPKKTAEEAQKETKDIFLGINKDTSLQKLTFITNNPLQIYSKEGPKPRIVRVVYSLIPSEDKTSFSLMRQESTNLDLKAFDLKGQQEIRKYALAANIKSMQAEYLYPEQVKEDESKKDKEQQPITYKAEKEWGKTPAEKDKQGPPKIPQFITITLELWDQRHRQSRTFVLHYAVAAFKSAIAKPKKQMQPPKVASPSTTPPVNTQKPTVGFGRT